MDPDERLADLSLPALAGGSDLAVETSRLGPLALAVDTLRRPSAAMARLAAHPDRRWIVPVLALVVVAVVTVAVELPATRAFQRQAIEAQFEQMPPELAQDASAEQAIAMTTSGMFGTVTLVFSVAAATIGTIAAVLIVAALLHLLGTAVGGQQTYGQVLAATSWARLPLVIGGVAWIAYVLTGHWDPSPSGLSGLVAPVVSDGETSRSYLEPVLARIELWTVWYLGLLVIAVRAASRVSRAKALALVVVLVALEIAVGMVGVAVARAFSGLMA